MIYKVMHFSPLGIAHFSPSLSPFFLSLHSSPSSLFFSLKDVLHKSELGNQSLAIIYIVFALANFIAPPIVDKLGMRLSMILVRRA